MTINRRFSIEKNGITLYPSAEDPKQRYLDLKQHIAALRTAIGDTVLSHKPKHILIVGASGSGKSLLAEYLTDTGKNTLLVHSEFNGGIPANKVMLPPMTDPSATFIFDEPTVFISDESLQSYLDEIAVGDGMAIILVQNHTDISPEMTKHMPVLRLTHENLQRMS